MCSENGLVERNRAKQPINHIHLETLTFSQCTNADGLEHNCNYAASVHPFGGKMN